MEEVRSLVERSHGGDLEAFGRLVGRFQDMAHGYAYAILGDFHLAEDAAQEAFVEAYHSLAGLNDPAAFPGWFRRIVFKQADRIARRRRVRDVPLRNLADVADPAQAVEQREMRERVLAAVRALPDGQRTATMLFYIDGYSQDEIAAFLEISVTAVKKRLHDARRKLKERTTDMVEDALKENAPDERFSRKVIDELLGRPRLLELPKHPVREVLDIIRNALPGYETVSGEEIVDKASYVEMSGNPDLLDHVYHVDAGHVLRTATTYALLRAVAGRMPPVHVLTAGRVFRPDGEETTNRLKVFHQLDVQAIATDADRYAMIAMLLRAIEAVLGMVTALVEPEDYPVFEHGRCVSVRSGERWVQVAGGGMLPAARLRESGYDPAAVSGFAFGLGLERLAMLKLGIEDIRALWQPPYVPEA